ncbi:hypothetical protein F4604DRAFT_1938680 [Suillus subluteus]|nr:hypothetical protein F4604DRAFT_1938680 [Suillus subluteus]
MIALKQPAILFIDTLNDTTGDVRRIQELGLRPYVIHDISEVADKERCPHIDTIVVDSLSMMESIREYEHLRYIPIVLLAPSMPCLNPQDLASALISALERNTVSPASAPNDVVFDILLAEDQNGSLAVEAFKARVQVNKPFDIILMDVSMPFMGGMEATELIRTYEMNKGLLRTPIVALTQAAHAMIGDRERCPQAGMDDHIASAAPDLLDLINKLAGARAQLAAQHHLLHRPPVLSWHHA